MDAPTNPYPLPFVPLRQHQLVCKTNIMAGLVKRRPLQISEIENLRNLLSDFRNSARLITSSEVNGEGEEFYKLDGRILKAFSAPHVGHLSQSGYLRFELGSKGIFFSLRSFPVFWNMPHIQGTYQRQTGKALDYGSDTFENLLIFSLLLSDPLANRFNDLNEKCLPVALPVPEGLMTGYCEKVDPEQVDTFTILTAQNGINIPHRLKPKWRPSVKIWLQDFISEGCIDTSTPLGKAQMDIFDRFHQIWSDPTFNDTGGNAIWNYFYGNPLNHLLSKKQCQGMQGHISKKASVNTPSQRIVNKEITIGTVDLVRVTQEVAKNITHLIPKVASVVRSDDWQMFARLGALHTYRHLGL